MPKKRMALRMIKDVIRLKWEGQLAGASTSIRQPRPPEKSEEPLF